jgi:hypothetical protein
MRRSTRGFVEKYSASRSAAAVAPGTGRKAMNRRCAARDGRIARSLVVFYVLVE